MKQFCKQEFPAGSLRHTAHTACGSSVINAAGKAGGARLDAGEGLQLIDAERWYVAHTQPHKEAVALRHLTEQGLRGFFPRQLKTVRHARKTRTIVAPLFPRYVFVILNLDRDRWLSVNGTLGITRLIIASGRPVPVPVGIVETLVESTDAAGKIKFAPGLAIGDKARLVAGPFAGALGVIERLDNAGRVSLLLKIMNREVRTSSMQDWLEPLVG
jgi:transcription antitermination factor NusG